MRLLVRADASIQRGTGHVMRCLALAQAWLRQGGQVTFLLAERLAGLEKRLAAEKVRLCYLSDHIEVGSAADAAETIAHAQNLDAAWLVVDGYDFGADYQQKVKQAGLLLLFIDDFGHCDKYCADVVLNQNVYANEHLYYQRSPNTKLLLGCDYALLRAEFRPWIGWQRKTKPIAQKLLVTLGGGDYHNQTLKILDALAFVETPLSVTVLVGAANVYQQILEETAVTLPKIHQVTFLRNIADMPTLITESDMAISAGGTTNWELAFLGLPTLILIIADNQREIASELHKKQIAYSLGWFEHLRKRDIASAIEKLSNDKERRTKMTLEGQNLVDGYGSKRVSVELRRIIADARDHIG
ncbi:MAG: UDP-2,4-diacetamido-2,4,6-trideoxy-beta-L-altropyranose hydrolase [Anaerolineaceae bacterium]|nr:UDP-2,4-diacetamido-2,4,6-trideoxy-beta-L-altropyranose hydrolase [Anaerolineaceae bacterium]